MYYAYNMHKKIEYSHSLTYTEPSIHTPSLTLDIFLNKCLL